MTGGLHCLKQLQLYRYRSALMPFPSLNMKNILHRSNLARSSSRSCLWWEAAQLDDFGDDHVPPCTLSHNPDNRETGHSNVLAFETLPNWCVVLAASLKTSPPMSQLQKMVWFSLVWTPGYGSTTRSTNAFAPVTISLTGHCKFSQSDAMAGQLIHYHQYHGPVLRMFMTSYFHHCRWWA